jgi:anion-transporting  ArsA/GET3 family ATPase
VLIDEFLAPKILIVSGKGGVGKTTVAAALALVAARAGRRVCVAEMDYKGTLARILGGGDMSYDPREITSGVWGVNVVPEDALREYLDVQYHMKRLSKVFTNTQFVDYITTAAPGLKDILVLGKIWYLEQGQSSGAPVQFDTIIVDAPAAGHMLTFLSAPMGLSDAVRLGPVKRQADWLVQMLRDPKRCRVHLVTLAEEMPVTETLETAEALHSRIGIDPGALVANGVYSQLFSAADRREIERMKDDGSDELTQAASEAGIRIDEEDGDAMLGYARFLEARRAIQVRHLRKLRGGVDEPIIELPFLFSAGLELPDIENLADSMQEGIEKL